MSRAVTVVVPTLGRPSLVMLLRALAAGAGPRPAEVVLVDDRPAGAKMEVPELAVPALDGLAPVRVVRAGGRGPAAARNAGWRRARTPWVAFLDDDVVPEPAWLQRLDEDLADLPAEVAGSQGRIEVPLPSGRRPTDWERVTAGLEAGRWITADMAYRRAALTAVGGFDERFPRAFREDADLALRVLDAGGRLVVGRRRTTHPVRPARWWVSLRVQAGNADDMLMHRLHGQAWRERAGAPGGRWPRHAAVTAAGAVAVGAALLGHRRTALLAGAGWLAGTSELFLARWRPGPRTLDETARMAATSVAIPPAALWHRARGVLRHRAAGPWLARSGARPYDVVLLDRDGTLVIDVPYNGDPDRVAPVPGARHALDRLRAAGVRVGVVTNQSGVGRGLLTREQVAAVNGRVEDLLGPFDTWQVCPHAPDAGCACRKPAPGLVARGCAELAVDPARCAVIGDIGADVEAARAAGATGVLVPTPVTRPEEVLAAHLRAPDLGAAVDLLLGGAA